MTTTETTTKPADAIAALGLTLRAEFVPWSQSRNKGEKDRTLNWRVTLLRNGREVLTTDYGQGIGHLPGYSPRTVDKIGAESLYHDACEQGRALMVDHTKWPVRLGAKLAGPDACDVINSLVLDSDVLNYSTFEEWASEFGYDPDSRKGEAIYRACLVIALKLRNGIGEAGMTQLREAFQDY